jgi:hypothetical protein
MSYDKLLNILRTRPLHHVLCAVFFVTYGINELKGRVELKEVIIALIVALAITIGTCLLIKLLGGRHIHSAIFTTLTFLVVLFYAHLFFFLISSSLVKSFLKEGYFIIITGVAIISLAIFLWRTPRDLRNLNLYLNILLIAYLAFEIKDTFKYAGNLGRVTISVDPPAVKEKQHFTSTPDIYFIIADAYANQANLKRYWNYDNQQFIEFLKQKGFYYVEHSRSNYDNTLSSIASTINGEYLPKRLDVNISENALGVQNHLLDKIQDSKVFRKLYNEGYTIHNLSLFTILNVNRFYLDRFFNRNFYNHLLSKTLPMRIYVRYTYMDHHGLLNELTELSQRKESKPKAVYCHLLLPHFPYIYDSTGQFKRPLNPRFKNPALYLNQLIYTNKLLMKSVSEIQQASPGAIIVLASDHGYRQLENEAERKKESTENFISIYFPDQDYSSLYDSMSSINIFSAIFAKLEQRKYEPEEDKINYFTE